MMPSLNPRESQRLQPKPLPTPQGGRSLEESGGLPEVGSLRRRPTPLGEERLERVGAGAAAPRTPRGRVTQSSPSWSRSVEPRVPAAVRETEAEIQRSRRLLELEDDWDEEGSPGYSEETWSRAIEYLRRQSWVCWLRYGVTIPNPRISPGPDGSIDIHWRTESYELLLNIPRHPPTSATFYGDDYARLSIRGTFDPTAEPAGHMALVSWLIRD